MFKRFRQSREACLPVSAGLVWLWYAHDFGVIGFVFAVIPGCLLLSAGISTLLYPGDKRLVQFIALGGAIGACTGLLALILVSVAAGLLLIVLSAGSFLCAGIISLRQEPAVKDVPPPQTSIRLATEVAIDESVLALHTTINPLFTDSDPVTVRQEVKAALELFQDQGWLENPKDYHRTPPPLDNVVVESCQSGELQFEHLCFESLYEPHSGEPGRDRWLSYRPNRTAHAWVLCQKDLSRPWVVCVHSYGMGIPKTIFRIFQARRLHRELGLNLAFPILPYHGPRKVGRFHGEGLGSGDVMDFVHAEAQAVWDIRYLLTWLRAQGSTMIGLGGVSLGGYNTALVASLEAELTCAIAGNPTADFVRQVLRHAPALNLRHAAEQGLTVEMVNQVMQVVSPLTLAPLIAPDRRYIFGATGDRIVPTEQVRDLWLHWEKPPILWYQGSHGSFNYHPEVNGFIGEALHKSGLIGPRNRRLATGRRPTMKPRQDRGPDMH